MATPALQNSAAPAPADASAPPGLLSQPEPTPPTLVPAASGRPGTPSEVHPGTPSDARPGTPTGPPPRAETPPREIGAACLSFPDLAAERPVAAAAPAQLLKSLPHGTVDSPVAVGSSPSSAAAALSRTVLAAGAKVEVLYLENARWYPATVQYIDDDGHIVVFYAADGQWEPWSEAIPPGSDRVRSFNRSSEHRPSKRSRHREAAADTLMPDAETANSPLSAPPELAGAAVGPGEEEQCTQALTEADAALIKVLHGLHVKLLDAISENRTHSAYQTMQELGPIKVTIQSLRVTKVGRLLKKLHTHSDALVALASKSVVRTWRALCLEQEQRETVLPPGR